MKQETLKEEPKQRLEKYSERFDNKDNELVEGVFNPENWGKRLVKEDADKDSFEDVTKYKKERSYSEEEVIELLQKALTHKDDGEIGSLVTAQGQIRTANFHSWFNKFKNK
jgi:hypothetical protein